MFIPMGSVVTVSMLLTVVFVSRFPGQGLNGISPLWLLRIVGAISVAAGLWNALWYGLRHLGQFWGHMALGSGVLMVLLGTLLILPKDRQPARSHKLRPVAALALLGFGLYYAWTIYHL